MNKSFRALILAAGLGTRLQPFTTHTPKCLVNINGIPLLGRWLDTLEDLGCESVLINTHHHAEKVENFLSNWPIKNMSIKTINEPFLLGTAGTLLKNKDFFSGTLGMLLHADNVTNADLNKFLEAHQDREQQCLLTMLTFKTYNPENCGIVQVDLNGVVQSFHEKVKNPPGDCANGALYLFDNSFLQWITKLSPSATDFSTDVLPELVNRIQTWHTNDIYIDIGTPNSLKKAQKLFKRFS